MTILYVLIAILLLGILVTVHEAGHFLAARLCGNYKIDIKSASQAKAEEAPAEEGTAEA